MKPLSPPDCLHVLAAEGWLELGNTAEANEELKRISARRRSHPEVLSVRWHIYSAAEQWLVALDLAQTVTKLTPHEATGWIQLACSQHKVGRTKEARDTLLNVLDRFPLNAAIRYNLACYECHLGRPFLAKRWLEKAFALADPKDIRLKALDDPDLEPLWKEIGTV